MRHEEVGVGMGMLRHDGEIEGVVMEDDVVKSRHKSFQAIWATRNLPANQNSAVPALVIITTVEQLLTNA